MEYSCSILDNFFHWQWKWVMIMYHYCSSSWTLASSISTHNPSCSVLGFSACNSACADRDDTFLVACCSIPTMNVFFSCGHLYVTCPNQHGHIWGSYIQKPSTWRKCMDSVWQSQHGYVLLLIAGICMSYVQTWACLRQLSSEARYLKVVKSGKWI